MLHKLINPQFSRKTKKRVGRGPGSGLGKTCGKGHKGQKARSGYNKKAGFEGGQTPLYRRLPKKGFKNIHAKVWNILNLYQVEQVSKLNDVAEINYSVLKDAGLIKNKDCPVKILAEGELTKPTTFSVHAASQSAIKKIEAAGGKVQIIKSA